MTNEDLPGGMNSKLSRSLFMASLTLTAMVVHTCVRIEIANARYGSYLPRTDFQDDGNNKWRNAGNRTVMNSLERQIAGERQNAYQLTQPESSVPEMDHFMGPPYTAEEQALIDARISENTRRLELHWWVSGFGLCQYIFAPLAFLSGGKLLLSSRSSSVRVVSGLCVLCSTVSIAFMIHRGYFTSLGW